VKRIKTDDARREFGTVINRVAFGGERIVLERRGKPLAAMIPMEELRLLERLIAEEEDRIDLSRVRESMAEAGPNVPLDTVMKELGIREANRRPETRRAAKPKKSARG
jgi:prevent-host-death family protein